MKHRYISQYFCFFFLCFLAATCSPGRSLPPLGSLGDECEETDDCDRSLGLVCDDGICVEGPLCADEQTRCSGQCCDAEDSCTDDGCCSPVRVCGSGCCEPTEFCHEGECIDCANIVCDGTCCEPEQRCHGGQCCDEGRVCGETCCEPGFLCELEQCRRDCGELARCGETDQCCEEGQICYFDECIDPGEPCTITLDCGPDEYCDYEVGFCLPRDETAECEYIPDVIVGAFNDAIVEWEWDFSDVSTTPVVASFNDDNDDGLIDDRDIPDVIFSFWTREYDGWDSIVAVLSGDDGSEIMRIPDYRVRGESSLAVGDVDSDGLPEIVACRSDMKGMYVFNHDGTLEWEFEEGCKWAWAYPTIVDLEGDGIVEIISGYTIFSGGTHRCDGTNIAGLAIIAIDITGDETLEIVSGGGAMDSECNRIREGGGAHTAVADFDLDGFPEIVSGGLSIMNPESGAGIYSRSVIGHESPGGPYPPTVADFDGDGVPEIALRSRYALSVYDMDCLIDGGVGECASGSLAAVLWSIPQFPSRVSVCSTFDFDGDGISELACLDSNSLRIHRGDDGTFLFEDLSMGGYLWSTPVVADVDGDNHAEIIVPSVDKEGDEFQGIRVYGDSENEWVSTRRIWNQYAYHITNINPDGSVPTHPEQNWTLPSLNNFRANQIPDSERLLVVPDIVVSNAAADTNFCSERLDLVARITNRGSTTAPEGIPVTFYRHTGEGNLGYIGVLHTSRRLSPGESETLTLPFNLYEEDLDTTIEFYVIADRTETEESTIDECIEDNNQSEMFSGMCPSLE